MSWHEMTAAEVARAGSMSSTLESITALDIRSAVCTAIEQGEEYQLERYSPTDCQDIPTGAEAAFFPLAGVVMIATNGDSEYHETCAGFELSLAAVVELLNTSN